MVACVSNQPNVEEVEIAFTNAFIKCRRQSSFSLIGVNFHSLCSNAGTNRKIWRKPSSEVKPSTETVFVIVLKAPIEVVAAGTKREVRIEKVRLGEAE